MMDAVRMWLLGVSVTSFLLSLAETLVTQEGVRRVLRLSGGVLLILVMVRPLLGLVGEVPAFSFSQYAEETAALEESFEKRQEETFSALIAEEAAAYISDKAEELGVPCGVTVAVGVEDGVPLPKAVEMTIPYHAGLSQWLERELKIGEENQVWQEK